ncbi:MAG TPA: glycosyltransferase family A protein [Anaerolineaceae bacterium]
MAFLTVFTAPKPFTNPHIATIQRNAIRSWLELGPDVEVLLIGQEDGLADFAAEVGVKHLPDVARNQEGTPLISSIFALAREHSISPLLAYVNADIILLPDFVQTARSVAAQAKDFLLVGQRWDMNINAPLEFGPGWQERLLARARQENRLHPRGGSDYFVYPRAGFANMPAFAVGRAGWDNWMIYAARCNGAAVVDTTAGINIIHQDHDYSHLPNGQPHYRLPETFENVRLAGGKLTIFKLDDTNYRLLDGKLARHPLTWGRFKRALEVFPLVTLHSRPLGWAMFALLHPKKAYAALRQRRDS